MKVSFEATIPLTLLFLTQLVITSSSFTLPSSPALLPTESSFNKDKNTCRHAASSAGTTKSTNIGDNIPTIRNALTALIKTNQCGPILIRLGWHDAATYDISDRSGGPRGCMRFVASAENKDNVVVSEAQFEANNGLDIARELVSPIKDSLAADMSYADFWALCAIVAVKAMGGPDVVFRVGRKDAVSVTDSVEEGRHPDGDKGADHLRQVFGRMGLNDQDIVALSGAHTTGKCHIDRSGFDGPWTNEPYKFDNSYFVDMLNKQWEPSTTAAGNPQFNCPADDTMMLISDLALMEDEKFRVLVEKYASDQQAFFDDFAMSFQKLLELGVKDLQEL